MSGIHNRADVAIVGTGTIGLVHAYVAASRGAKVVVFGAWQARHRGVGAQLRNDLAHWPGPRQTAPISIAEPRSLEREVGDRCGGEDFETLYPETFSASGFDSGEVADAANGPAT